jgi:hypothetical protein
MVTRGLQGIAAAAATFVLINWWQLDKHNCHCCLLLLLLLLLIQKSLNHAARDKLLALIKQHYHHAPIS